jgi:hypothetical protein
MAFPFLFVKEHEPNEAAVLKMKRVTVIARQKMKNTTAFAVI